MPVQLPLIVDWSLNSNTQSEIRLNENSFKKFPTNAVQTLQLLYYNITYFYIIYENKLLNNYDTSFNITLNCRKYHKEEPNGQRQISGLRIILYCIKI